VALAWDDEDVDMGIAERLAGLTENTRMPPAAVDPWTNPLSREGFLRSRAQLEI